MEEIWRTHVHGLLAIAPLPPVIRDPVALKAGFSHREDNGKLFDHAPIASDVKQGNVGDCYYPAAALAILNKPSVAAVGTNPAQISGAEFIESMMKDHGDKTVTVRFLKKGRTRRVSAALRSGRQKICSQ